MTNKWWRSLSPEKRRKWTRICNWVIVINILIILSTCIDWTDIRVLDTTAETKDNKALMHVSVGPGVADEELMEWISWECRDLMILPPIRPVPIEVRQRDDGRGRTEYLFRCTRP